ncbi:T9SS type A sorting domain-containing protein [candidate division WOR-3 bacterium]|nr:T9SS type A sorting domain-containing protein [candidate division WOR-3 bacterium]
MALDRRVAAGRSGAVSLDLRSLSAGIYLVRLETDGYSGTAKLVVQK